MSSDLILENYQQMTISSLEILVKPQLPAIDVENRQQFGRYTTRKLENEFEIKLAQNLVYSVFVEEMNWILANNNPSGIKYIDWQDSKIFVDDFDDVAIWFGTFHEQKLIACWRFCSPLAGSYELERYHPVPEFLKQAKSLELTRLVIHPAFRSNSLVMFNLYTQTYIELYQQHDYVFAAPSFPNPGNLYLKLGAKKVQSSLFKYNIEDSNFASLIYLDFHEEALNQKVLRQNKIILNRR